MYEAQDLVAVAAADAYAELRPRMSELAASLARDPDYIKANNQNLRRRAAQRFLARQVGGYRPTTEDRDLLLAEMPQKSRLLTTQDDALLDYI